MTIGNRIEQSPLSQSLAEPRSKADEAVDRLAGLYDVHAPGLLAYLGRRVADPAIAEELAAEAFARLLREIQRGRAPAGRDDARARRRSATRARPMAATARQNGGHGGIIVLTETWCPAALAALRAWASTMQAAGRSVDAAAAASYGVAATHAPVIAGGWPERSSERFACGVSLIQ